MSDKPSKKEQEKNEKDLLGLVVGANGFCADCGIKGTRWASWNLGVFLCIKCCGVHRKLGPELSKIKSLTLDTWTSAQVDCMRAKGNARINALYNPNNAPPPKNIALMEAYVRDKYERLAFMEPSKRPLASQLVAPKTAAVREPSNRGSGTSYLSLDKSSHLPAHISPSDSSRFGDALLHLHEMGFVLAACNLNALKASQGDLSRAIEYLIAAGQLSEPAPAKPASPLLEADPTPPSQSVSKNASALVDLSELYFQNEAPQELPNDVVTGQPDPPSSFDDKDSILSLYKDAFMPKASPQSMPKASPQSMPFQSPPLATATANLTSHSATPSIISTPRSKDPFEDLSSLLNFKEVKSTPLARALPSNDEFGDFISSSSNSTSSHPASSTNPAKQESFSEFDSLI